MKYLKSFLKTPYLYIFLFSYCGVWLVWEYIKLPAINPAPDGIISHLSTVGYNPSDNILRFLAAILIPPLICMAYWWFTKNVNKVSWFKSKLTIRSVTIVIAIFCTFLALGMGMIQGTLNPANNPPDPYGTHKYFLVDTFHEGETLGPAVSYQQPNLKPYTNFVVVHGVFQDPLRSVIAFKLFGRSIGAERTFSTILFMLVCMCYFGLLLVLFRNDLIKSALALGILAILMLPASALPYFNKFFVGVQLPFRDVATIAFLSMAVLSLRWAIAKRVRAVAISSGIIGFIVTANFANSVDRAIYIAALSILWAVMAWLIIGWKSWRKVVLLPYIVGFILGILVLGIALKGDFSGIITYLSNISRYKDYLDGEEFMKPGLAISLVLLALSATVAAALFWMARFWESKKQSSFKNVSAELAVRLRQTVLHYHTEILLGFTALVFMRSAIGRADIGHFNYSVQWIYLLVAYIVINYVFAHKKLRDGLNFIVVLALVFVSVFYVTQLKAAHLSQNTFPLHVPDSQLVRPDYLQTAAYLKQNLHGQNTFVTLTSEGIWYYLVDKPSPIQYPIIWYAFTGPQRASIANSIADNPHIKYIVTNNNWTSDFDFVPNPVRFPEVYKVLDNDYVPKVGFGQQTVWQRK